MNISPIRILRAVVYPLTESNVLIPLIFFWLMISLASWGGLLGLFLMFLVLPALLRYQMILMEARARGTTPEIPGIEFFDWFGRAWTLFPVILVVLLVAATVAAGERLGLMGQLSVLVFAGVFFPAAIAVLAITHSPIQSLNPIALYRLFRKCGGTLWLATVYLLIIGWASLEAEGLTMMLAVLLQLVLSFSFFSLLGSLIEPYGVIEDVDVPAPLQQDETAAAEDLEKTRRQTLSHAYGFISRGNRDGGMKHLLAWIGQDPDPIGAWGWFFDRMLAWDDPMPALFFAQHYVHDALQHGEQVPAVKLIMRCRLVDEKFRPFPEDIQAAVAAANACNNQGLAAALERH